MASRKNKFQGTYRVGMKVPDERVNRLKADVDKFGSFPQFVDALYDAYLAKEIAPVVSSDEADEAGHFSPTTIQQIDDQKILVAIEDAKRAILSSISQYQEELSSYQNQTPVVSQSPVLPEPQVPAVSEDVIAAHKDDIIKQIVAAHQIEIARLDDMLAEIRNISATASAPKEQPEANEQSCPDALEANVPSQVKGIPEISEPETKTHSSSSGEKPVSAPSSSSASEVNPAIESSNNGEATMTQEEASSFVDELVGWVSDKSVETESDLDVIELVNAKKLMEIPDMAPMGTTSHTEVEEPDAKPETYVIDRSAVSSEHVSAPDPSLDGASPASTPVPEDAQDEDEEKSFITEEDLDDDIIAGLAAIWGEE